MFEENGRIDTKSEYGNKKIEKEKKVVCLECGEEFILEQVEFGERLICNSCRKLV